MPIVFTESAPDSAALHVDFGPDPRARHVAAPGVVLTLVDPSTILDVARSVPRRRRRTDWVVWEPDALPMSERRVAAWLTALGRVVEADVFVVMNRPPTGRLVRIAGHVERATARRR